MSYQNHGCTGGCFESPTHYSYNNEYDWYDYEYDCYETEYNWYDYNTTYYSMEYKLARQLSEEYWSDQYFPKVVKNEPEIGCLSFLLKIFF